MTWLRCLVLALALVAAAAETDLERRVEQLVEDFRVMMPNGVPKAGIPCLDPANVASIPITVKLPVLTADANATNVVVPGVSGFRMTELAQQGDSNTLVVKVEVPPLHVTGQYDVTGKAKIGFIKVNVKGNGPLKVSVKGVKGSAKADVTVNDDDSLSLAALKVTDWSYTDVSIELDNLMGGGAVGKAVNALVNTLVPTFLNANKNKINNIVETKGKKVIDDYLNSLAGRKTFAFNENIITEVFALAAEQHDWIIPAEAEVLLDQLALVATGLQSIE